MGKPQDPWRVVQLFNDCITAGDIDGLARLMTADHTFTDSAGNAWHGRDRCVQAWSGFFEAFPGYRNVFTQGETRDALVVVRGYSVCTEPALDGPAIWAATVRGDRVADWRVYEDTAEVRTRLGLT